MGSLTGPLHRPFAALVAVVAAVVSVDVPDILHLKNVNPFSYTVKPALPLINETPECTTSSSWFSSVSVSDSMNLSTIERFSIFSRAFLINGKLLHHQFSPLASLVSHNSSNFIPKSVFAHCSKMQSSSSLSSVPILFRIYKSANLSYGLPTSFFPCPNASFSSEPRRSKHLDFSTQSRYFHNWHLPKEEYDSGQYEPKKPVIAVVLLGWLGAKQKHLKRYADWYISRGIHAITFTVPMKDIASYKPGGKADQSLDMLVTQLAHWMREDMDDSAEKCLIFHTFSNTGWLTYGVLLEKFLTRQHTLVEKIKGCVVDSAPVATPDPQVWASGFSAALLKKNSIAAKGLLKGMEGNEESANIEIKPAVAETALLVMLEKFFKVFLKLPNVDRRLSDVLGLLSNQQPKCPQLYIYSSADRVIPAEYVEAFIEKQKKAGHKVRACNFEFSPHVDHFRNFPDLYSAQLSSFLEDCVSSHKDQ